MMDLLLIPSDAEMSILSGRMTPVYFDKIAVQYLKLKKVRGCGSPPGVIVADTLSFNAKMDLVDF